VPWKDAPGRPSTSWPCRRSLRLRYAPRLGGYPCGLAPQVVRPALRSKHPGIRAIEAVALTIPLFLLLFASTYFLMSAHGPGAFSQEDLTRTDALYLAVTIFSTVGFGDISATSQAARLVVTSQMILDLLVLGIVINAFVHAARLGRQRSSAEEVGEPRSA
jgi:voltage-gated potassium channel